MAATNQRQRLGSLNLLGGDGQVAHQYAAALRKRFWVRPQHEAQADSGRTRPNLAT